MSIQQSPESAIRKVALIALAGTSIEWYDFFLYGTAAALIFPTKFFPAHFSPLAGLFAAFSTFAIGFVARPIGGIVFGHFGDRIGRKKVLVAALVLMGLSTSLIGLLPTYATWGIAAPALLVALRFMQGFAIGGQWGGATLLVTETAPAAKRGFYGSFAQVGAPAGVVLANSVFFAVSSSLSSEDFMSWGWRLPFLLSIALIGLALYVQLSLEDTPSFRQLQKIKNARDDELRRKEGRKALDRADNISPVLQALRIHPREIALVAGAFMANQVVFYVLVAFVIAYGTSSSGLNLSRSMLLGAVMAGTLLMVPAIVISAAISDRWGGRRGVYMVGAGLLFVWSFILFPLIETRNFLWILVAISIGQICIGIMYGPQAALITELFGTKVRYSGASLGYQAGAIFGGALAPLISTALLARFGGSFGVSVYMACACLITFGCVFALKETRGRDLNAIE
jgi:metabolite-proton symporter